MPVVDNVLKDFHGRIVNSVELPRFTFGKELQMHVVELKPNAPFESPIEFEETMQEAVLTIQDFLRRKYHANLLGTGMHPFLELDDTRIWPHRHKQIYEAYSKLFNLRRHGWLNIQSYQLNLPYSNEKEGILLHSLLAEICAYLPAICASTPIYESRLGEYVDNRLMFYAENQKEIPSITGDVIAEYVSSFKEYRDKIIGGYSRDLIASDAERLLVNKEWVNSRGVIFRFDRRAVEIRVMDEQECVKSDVAISCFVRSLLRGLMTQKRIFMPHGALVDDYNSVVRNGFKARVQHPNGKTARDVCQHFLQIACANASDEEKKYLLTVRKRIENGSLSQIIRDRVQERNRKTDFKEAVIDVYSKLLRSLVDNEQYL